MQNAQKTFKIDQIKPAIFTIKNDYLITNYENALTASDTYTNNVPGLSIKMGCKKYVINENLAI